MDWEGLEGGGGCTERIEGRLFCGFCCGVRRVVGGSVGGFAGFDGAVGAEMCGALAFAGFAFAGSAVAEVASAALASAAFAFAAFASAELAG